MATVTKYSFEKTMDIPSITAQIQASAIVTIIDHIDVADGETDIWFKDVLSSDDETTLDTVVTNYSYVAPAPAAPVSVTTQFEQKQYVLALACATSAVGGDGTATIIIKVPGTPGGADGRYVNAGEAFFDIATAGDQVLGVWVIDHDNLLGNGADVVIGSYTDDAADESNRGWYIPPIQGRVKAETIGFYGFIPSGFWLKIVGKKGAGLTSGNLYLNMEWATDNS